MTKQELLTAVAAGKITVEEAISQLPDGGRAMTMKVAPKGGITFHHVKGTHHSFGLTLFAETLEQLFAHRVEIEKFIQANVKTLSRKS